MILCQEFMTSDYYLHLNFPPNYLLVMFSPVFQCHDAFVQFSSFLASQMSTEELRQRLPSMSDLISQYHLTADTAFPICRMLYTHAVQVNRVDVRRRVQSKIFIFYSNRRFNVKLAGVPGIARVSKQMAPVPQCLVYPCSEHC